MEFDLLFGAQDTETGGLKNDSLVDDLRLDVLLRAMAGEDSRMAEVCRSVLLRPLTDAEKLAARRAVRRDVAAHPHLFEELLAAAREAEDGAVRYAEFQKPRYDRVISNQKKLLTECKIARLYEQAQRRMHAAVTAGEAAFCSDAVCGFTKQIHAVFSPEYTARIEDRLNRLESLRLSDDLTLSAAVGGGLKPANVVLNALAEPEPGRRFRRTQPGDIIALTSVGLVRNAEDMVQSAVLPLVQAVTAYNKRMKAFCGRLSFQLCFYLGCARLEERLRQTGVALCEPELGTGSGIESDGLVSAALALQLGKAPAGNAVRFAGKRLVIVTGVNQGGKTTFLRSVGLAQLMAQCGLFVTARYYRAPLYSGIFTHFPSGEDTARGMGLLDVELGKLSAIVDGIRPHSLLLLNETFQTTMPQDAKYLAEITVRALTDSGITVVFVTHLYAYAAAEYARRRSDTLFLRAERGETAENAFVLRESEPYRSAAGMALYREVLGG